MSPMDLPPNLNPRDGYFQCGSCKNHYNRADHLIRHVRSHTREKPFVCDICNKGFARPDLMKRHASGHDSTRGVKRKSSSLVNRNGRVSQACKSCATSKLKCDEQKPCRRCRSKKLICDWPQDTVTDTPPEQSQERDTGVHAEEHDTSQLDTETSPVQAAIPVAGNADGHLDMSDLPMGTSVASEGMSPVNNEMMATAYGVRPANQHIDPHLMHKLQSDQTVSPLTDEGGTFSIDGTFFPDFIPDSLIPSLARPSDTDPPLNVAQDYVHYGAFDHNLQFDFNLSDSDFGLIDIFNSRGTLQDTDLHLETAESNDDFDADSGIAIGAEAFRRSSLSAWKPAQEDHALADQENLSVPTSIDSPESSATSDRRILSERLSASNRDLIFGIVLETSKQANMMRIMKSFPSAELLDSLIQSFFEHQRAQLDSWVHGPTFQTNQEDPEMLAALAASGAVRSTIPTIRKLGYALMEIVRLHFPMKYENDNSTTRGLRSSQIYALVIDIGIWSGNRRRTEIAESFGQPLVTMLRRALRFRRSVYSDIIPSPDDTEEILDRKWREWVEQESFKRLVYHIFCHDGQSSMMLHVNPLISYAELELPLPASRQLWEARNAMEWKEIRLSTFTLASERSLSLVDLLQDMSQLAAYQRRVDSQLAAFVVLHGIASMVHEYHQLKFISKGNSKHWRTLVISSRHQELSEALQHFQMVSSGWDGPAWAEIDLVREVISMLLHMSLEELQLFAGKEDRREARRVYDSALEWINSADSRRAVWHAGQAIRAATAMTRGSLTGFFAIAVYYASLALWSYSVVSQAKDRVVAGQLPSCNGSPGDWSTVFLDGEDTAEVQKFITLGWGRPALRGRQEPVPVGDACQTMDVAEQILRGDASHGALPPLVQSLCQLLSDLGKAAGRTGGPSGVASGDR